MRQIKGLRADLENIAGDIKLSRDFEMLEPIERLDILRDWLCCLTHEYNAAHDEWQEQLTATRH